MIKCITCPALNIALEKLKEIIALNESRGKNTVIFCEDRLTLAAERTVCAAVGGTFSVSVYTFARFLSSERGKRDDVLSSQGSAMAIRTIIEELGDKLKLFGKLQAASAAAAVYDTIALLYSSKISADDVEKAAAEGLLETKLRDVALIYSSYEKYLKDKGKTDRNAYLSSLPEVISTSRKIADSEVIFLGFQSFTRSSLECVRSTFEYASSVVGLFIGGREELYVNEGAAAFTEAAKEFGGAESESVKSTLTAEAEKLRVSLFNPDVFHKNATLNTQAVNIFEAADENEELEFIAATIKKHVLDGGERYAKISVMVPDVAEAERDLKRIFSEYNIPYYADRRHKLSEHPISSFIIDFLNCALSGCSFRDSDGVIASPLFPATREDKDEFRNYALRLASFRGGVKREPKKEILEKLSFDYNAVQRVRQKFLSGLKLIPLKGNTGDIVGGLRALLTDFKTDEKLLELSEKFKDSYPTQAQFCKRVYEATLNVLAEAEEIAPNLSLKEFIKVLKSGFAALEISLIPPKADAVFVGDLAATANTGSNVVFAARLTGDVPSSSADTALLTDREIAALERINLDISPKIRQVNMRRRELTALNICAFRKCLYLTYPVRLSGEEGGSSEIISYAQAVFTTRNNAPLKPFNYRLWKREGVNLPYFCCEKLPALKAICGDLSPEAASSVYGVLKGQGFEEEAIKAITPNERKPLSDGSALFVKGGSVSPTTLETYFSCPYRNFMERGLRLKERDEGAMRPLDTGNFIHAVLQTLAQEIDSFPDVNAVEKRAREVAEKTLLTPEYASMKDSKSGEYDAGRLVEEATAIGLGMYEQLANSDFKPDECEYKCRMTLDDGISMGGRIDRIDSCGDMVRIIDYKTGANSAEVKSTEYYMGLKLQLPLYLLAVSEGKRAVGAYYFPASTEYRSKSGGVFRLQGFMDGSEEVVSASDKTVQPKAKSAYVNAYLNGIKLDSAMPKETFEDFLKYSVLVARQGAREMIGGNIEPSPSEGACEYCKMSGSCGFAVGIDGEGRTHDTVNCGEIANIVKRERGDKQ